MDHRARTSHRSRTQTHAFARASARTLSARRSLSPAPHSCRSSLSSQRLCAGFHASPDSLMGAARSRHLILSAHTWARAAFAGTGLPLPACLCRSSAPGSGRPPPAHCNLSSTRCSPVARSVITRRRAYSGARCSPRPVRPSRADGLPSLGADTLSGPIEARQADALRVQAADGLRHHHIRYHRLRRRHLRLRHAVRFRPEPEQLASAAALCLPSPPRFTDEEKRQFPRLNSCCTLS